MSRTKGIRPLLLFVLISIVLFVQIASAIPAQGQRMMVAGPSPYSIEITQEIAKRGGNVVDAAVAVALGLAVTTPYYAALGGGGFALVRMAGKPVEALDFRETAPQASHRDLYKEKPKNASTDGGLAVGVPGVPAGLWALHKKYGKLPWKDLFRKPIHMAQEGFRVSGEWSSITKKTKDRFSIGGKRAFFKSKDEAYLPGDILKQPALGTLLKDLSARGPKAFYEGAAARDIVAAVRSTGGVLTEADMKSYRVRWLEPLKMEYLGYTLHLMPPPSSGGVVMTSALKMIEMTQLKQKRPLSADELHTWAEILRISFRSRNLLGDPAFVENPITKLTSTEFLQPLVTKIRPNSTLRLEPLKESEQTTHFSILDADGNSIAFTVTLNGNYGSGVVSESFGVALNNEMDDFTTRPGESNMFGLVQGAANEIAPGKRPLSSMSPTLVEKDGRVVLSLGSPGGPRIISAVTQVLYRVLANGMDMDQAIQAPRVHHQYLPDTLFVDPMRVSPDVLDLLTKRGHKIEESPIAKVYGVRRNDAGLLEAAFDSRGEGGAGGL